MGKLSSGARNKLPSRDFAGPGRSYPIPDRSHAANAKARASQQLHKGNLTKGQYSHIVSRANAELGEYKKK